MAAWRELREHASDLFAGEAAVRAQPTFSHFVQTFVKTLSRRLDARVGTVVSDRLPPKESYECHRRRRHSVVSSNRRNLHAPRTGPLMILPRKEKGGSDAAVVPRSMAVASVVQNVVRGPRAQAWLTRVLGVDDGRETRGRAHSTSRQGRRVNVPTCVATLTRRGN